MLITRNTGATYFIPTEDEWYKAAYYDPTLNSGAGGYWSYPTKSNSTPSNALSGSGSNNANCFMSGYSDPTNYLTPVGAFTDSPGPYGTYDMGGNVYQWNEANIGGSSRGLRGGSFNNSPNGLASADRVGGDPTGEIYDVIGFRVASVPEPSSITLVVAGALGFAGVLLHRRWRDAKV